jgi:DNA-binding transcriptional LysR family regulator
MSDIDEAKIRRLDFSLLLVFRELVRHRRTTVAATRLGLSQSAISHALARLRDIFGEPLFLRRSDGLQPTRGALELAPKVDAMIAMAADAVGGERAFDPARSTRTFRLAANDFVASMLAPSLAAGLKRDAPHVRFATRFAVGASALQLLRSDTVDVALGRFLSLSDEHHATPLAEETYRVAARARHPALRKRLSLQTYLALDHVLVSFRGDLQGTVDQALAQQGLSRRVAASVPMFLTALAMVAEGDLVATVPTRLAERYAPSFGLQLFTPPLQLDAFGTSAVRHTRSRGDAGLDWLIERLTRLWPQESD